MATSDEPGHVFVALADLTRLACDDVLVPTDRRLEVAESWLPLLPEHVAIGEGKSGKALGVEPTDEWRAGGRVLRVSHENRDGPRIWLAETAGDRGDDLDWTLGGVEAYFDAVLQTTEDRRANDRARRLVALPLVGTGGGAAITRRGDLITKLLPLLGERARATGFDVVLVLREPSDHAAVQHVRRTVGCAWPLSEDLREHAEALAGHARDGRLALFLGAGVGAAAGLPLWSDLLAELAERAEFGDDLRAGLGRLTPQDAAALVARRLGAEATADYVAERFAERPHALAHALLAGLPVSELATTNFDPLFESAARGVGRDLRVVPLQDAVGAEQWLLKMHGDVSAPESVVLTRDQYLLFESERAALAGVVQAMLLTRHVLFVGFSLLDDNFVRIVHDVRGVLDRWHRAAHERSLGTALAIVHDPVRAELWGADLDYVAMAPPGTATADAARLLEVFLDQLGALATPATGFLLDPAYAGMLSAEEQALADALHRLGDELPPRVRDAAAWAEVDRLLARLGGRARR